MIYTMKKLLIFIILLFGLFSMAQEIDNIERAEIPINPTKPRNPFNFTLRQVNTFPIIRECTDIKTKNEQHTCFLDLLRGKVEYRKKEFQNVVKESQKEIYKGKIEFLINRNLHFEIIKFFNTNDSNKEIEIKLEEIFSEIFKEIEILEPGKIENEEAVDVIYQFPIIIDVNN